MTGRQTRANPALQRRSHAIAVATPTGENAMDEGSGEPRGRGQRVREDEVLAILARTKPPVLDTLGGGVVAYDKGLDRVTMQWQAETRHCHSVEGHPRGGIVQGGIVTGWIDSAMAHACVAKSVFTVGVPSLEIKVSFLSAAHPGIYRSYGWVVKWGRSIAFLEGELRDEEGALIARASSTAALRHLKK